MSGGGVCPAEAEGAAVEAAAAAGVAGAGCSSATGVPSGLRKRKRHWQCGQVAITALAGMASASIWRSNWHSGQRISTGHLEKIVHYSRTYSLVFGKSRDEFLYSQRSHPAPPREASAIAPSTGAIRRKPVRIVRPDRVPFSLILLYGGCLAPYGTPPVSFGKAGPRLSRPVVPSEKRSISQGKA